MFAPRTAEVFLTLSDGSLVRPEDVVRVKFDIELPSSPLAPHGDAQRRLDAVIRKIGIPTCGKVLLLSGNSINLEGFVILGVARKNSGQLHSAFGRAIQEIGGKVNRTTAL